MFYITKLCLHKLLKFLQPVRVLSLIFSGHVLVKVIGSASVDTPDFQIFTESLLQLIIQVPKRPSKIDEEEMSIDLINDNGSKLTNDCQEESKNQIHEK